MERKKEVVFINVLHDICVLHKLEGFTSVKAKLGGVNISMPVEIFKGAGAKHKACKYAFLYQASRRVGHHRSEDPNYSFPNFGYGHIMSVFETTITGVVPDTKTANEHYSETFERDKSLRDAEYRAELDIQETPIPLESRCILNLTPSAYETIVREAILRDNEEKIAELRQMLVSTESEDKTDTTDELILRSQYTFEAFDRKVIGAGNIPEEYRRKQVRQRVRYNIMDMETQGIQFTWNKLVSLIDKYPALFTGEEQI